MFPHLCAVFVKKKKRMDEMKEYWSSYFSPAVRPLQNTLKCISVLLHYKYYNLVNLIR
jgi:hypothetical protein